MGKEPVWQVQSSLSTCSRAAGVWNVWTASADGCVRAYRVQEKDIQDELNASALSLINTHVFLGSSQVYPPTASTLLGCSQVSKCRNYVGDDDAAGDLVVASLDLTGRVRVWTCTPDSLDADASETGLNRVKATHEFSVNGATGTVMALCPPNLSGQGDVLVAIAMLDGTVAMVATGLATPKATKDASDAGTVVDNWGSGSIAMSLTWHPNQHVLAVGRKDGVVDILPATKKGPHRLVRHGSPVRAVAYTPDTQLLISGSDEGMLCVWDVNRKVPTLVHHVVQAHTSWILSVSVLSDSRRFVSCGADCKIHVWNVGQIYAPMHTFQTDSIAWTTHVYPKLDPPRLVTGSEDGFVQVYSLD